MPNNHRIACGPLVLLVLVGCSEPAAQPEGDPAPERWVKIKREITARFKAVPSISTTELQSALRGEGSLLLLDVRAKSEFEVSHLRGARNAPPGADLPQGLLDLPRDRPIVTYCSVGYRSAMLAERLLAAGFTDVRNYLGSIFEWANSGLPIYDDRGAARSVHPYDAHWGELLREELRAKR